MHPAPSARALAARAGGGDERIDSYGGNMSAERRIL